MEYESDDEVDRGFKDIATSSKLLKPRGSTALNLLTSFSIWVCWASTRSMAACIKLRVSSHIDIFLFIELLHSV